MRKLAFLHLGSGKFQPREIVTGVESENGMVQVLHGLEEGDVVVTSGQFLLDAESKLREAVAKMMAARKVAEKKKAGGGESGTEVPDHSGHGGETHDALTTAKYACPMAEHPDAEDVAQRGPYFSAEAGKCPVCGMKLEPIGDLKWARALRAAKGGDVAYSCPAHSAVLSDQPGKCPRGAEELEPFKALYTCPDERHAGVIETSAGECPTCEQQLAIYRGPWLSEELAAAAAPPQPVGSAPYRCPDHPGVQSEAPGRCTLCAQELESTQDQPPAPTTKPIASAQGAKYVCPMKSCNHFSAESGDCPTCGMFLKPIAEVPWAKEAQAAGSPPAEFTCPMHPQVQEARGGDCPICAMRLVPAGQLPSSDSVQQQVDFIAEHYLALQHQLAADTTAGVARNALGLVAAAEKLTAGRNDPNSKVSPALAEVAQAVHAAALGITEEDLATDRLRFSELSAAFIKLLDQKRPSRERWPALSLFRCPMAKADWVQATESLANPYYGFKMRSCGTQQGTK